MAKAKKYARIEKLKELPALGRKPKPSWFDRLPASDREELAVFRQQWKDGEYAGHTETALFDYWQDMLKLPIEKSAFFNWLKRPDRG